MMKKTLILASFVVFATIPAVFANDGSEAVQPSQRPAFEQPRPEFGQQRPPKRPDVHRQKFEERLKLTDEQKAQAKELHQKGLEQMKPIMEQIKTKKEEARAVKLSRIAVEEQEAKLQKIREEIRALNKQAHELRMKNMKDFENILTKKQKKELEKIKKEGRKNFEKHHKKHPHPGFRPAPGPEFGHGPALPPPEPPVEK